jgi:hypothetical protein
MLLCMENVDNYPIKVATWATRLLLTTIEIAIQHGCLRDSFWSAGRQWDSFPPSFRKKRHPKQWINGVTTLW